MFEPYLTRWQLTPDGEPIVTPSSRLLPVRHAGQPAMLKVAVADEERRGAALMRWWDGDGAARVLAHAGAALLLERLSDEPSLAALVLQGGDSEASRIICAVAARLHASRAAPPPTLVPLAAWFAALAPAAAQHGGLLRLAAATARELLATPRNTVVLHGDLHHGNILPAGARGWLAIDPKGLLGERTFDFANLFRNPTPEHATAPGRLAHQAQAVAAAAGLERARLLQWVLAYAGLSAAWGLADGEKPALDLAVAEQAAAALAHCRLAP